MANWYTADTHFNHASIIRFCNRPFRDIAEMDQAILRNFEARVGWDDDLWIVGDFAFGGETNRDYIQRCFDRLPGRKHLVVGNHDPEPIFDLGWASVADMAEVTEGDQVLVLCHYPMLTWKDARKGAIHLFGHVHENWRGSRNAVNVGVDVWNFAPIQLADILKRAKGLPVNKHWGDVEPRDKQLGRRANGL